MKNARVTANWGSFEVTGVKGRPYTAYKHEGGFRNDKEGDAAYDSFQAACKRYQEEKAKKKAS